ncbi:hypothetical protein [Streptomyces sp. NPDC002057]|uniref:hypothetical protein n=1 Tax=Streptomyces sp. NPDC002057 TaxID=3154664 RepID=UPI00332DDD0A
MSRVRAVVAAVVLVSAVAGCGAGDPVDAKPPAGRPTADAPSAAPSSAASAVADVENEKPSPAGKLGADPGTRYRAIAVPALEGQVCDEGDGGFHYGSDLDMIVSGDDDLKRIEGDSQDLADEVSCFGSPRNVLRMGSMSATTPTFTARTTLYEQVADPVAALNRIFDASVELATGYGRDFNGEAKVVTSDTLVVKCRQNVTNTFPMTTCFWANYGAAGVVDFFPANGEQYVPIDSAVPWTQDFVAGALRA